MNQLSMDDKRQIAQRYIGGTCTMEQEQTWESLLLEDAEAMELHIQLLSSMELRMPNLTDVVQFTDKIMNRLPDHLYEVEANLNEQRRRWFEHPVFHYTVAACLTLLFLSTGIFDKLVSGDLNVVPTKETISYSDQMMNMTVDWLDQLKR